MSPLSWPVLGGAALLSSPALYHALVLGTTTTEVALTRYLASVAICWALVAFVGMLVGPVAREPHTSAGPAGEDDLVAGPAGDPTGDPGGAPGGDPAGDRTAVASRIGWPTG